ncbi:MAG: mercury methylation corrinoid protein HgcA [Candidatus Nitrospinota bacterium M3_3B_026]
MDTQAAGCRCAASARESAPCSPAPVRCATGEISLSDRWVHIKASLGIDRFGHRVEPGLYALGSPSENSSVLVTANYKPSFDALRSVIAGMDAWILVLDTKGVNVWCAAGKGTFGTDELVKRIESVGLRDFVFHRRLILPQLGAPGVAAHVVKKRSGFKVEYGPVFARDLPEFLKAGKATARMRRVRFPLRDRAALIPVELVIAAPYVLAAAFFLYFAGGWVAASSALAAALAGLVLFPMLLPVIPFNDFSVKGFLIGAAVSAPFAAWAVAAYEGTFYRFGWAAFFVLFITSVAAYFSLNFTGSTTFTSQTGVQREVFRYFPLMFWMFLVSAALAVALPAARFFGAV